jgi:glycosyltransferase involved in cell wall biosynthesis
MKKSRSIKSLRYKKLSIVIPAWNEGSTVRKVLDDSTSLSPKGIEIEVIIINDASTDNTGKILQNYKPKKGVYKLIVNKKNLGKSQSVKRGILESTGDLVVVHDADNELRTKDLLELIDVFQKDTTVDAVYGNRFHAGNHWGGKTYIGNKILTVFSNLFTAPRGFIVKDMEVCFKMVKGNIFREIAAEMTSISRFGLEPEITARLAKRRVNVKNVDIYYKPRHSTKGKKLIPLPDGIKAIYEIVKYNLFA